MQRGMRRGASLRSAMAGRGRLSGVTLSQAAITTMGAHISGEVAVVGAVA
jgi:hypothetical protein